MKIKIKQTIEKEAEISLPAFFEHNGVYYAAYSEEDKWTNGLRVDECSIMFHHPSSVANYGTYGTQITEQEFNAFMEKTLHKIQSIFYQTVNQ